MKKSIYLMSLMLFVIIASVIALWPNKYDHNFGMTSSELQTVITKDGNEEKVSYINQEGLTTIAIDMGYATVHRIRNSDGKIIQETYFDTEGAPIKRNGEFYGVSFEYGDDLKITYLDENKNPAMCSSGYSYLVKKYSSNGQVVNNYYYDLSMNPVKCLEGYYGIQQELDNDGNVSREIYLDDRGQPVCNESGYAIIIYKRAEDKKIAEEYYFDERGYPTISLKGLYGEKYQRNEAGRISQITYLDLDGNPAPTNAGYTVLERTYYRDGTIDEDMYFDAYGNAIALSKGQYGIKHLDKAKLLLDKKGRVMFCVDNILNGLPFMVVVFGCAICLFLIFLPRKASAYLTFLYTFFILYETLMFREIGESRTNFVLFSYAGLFFADQSVRAGVINNIWLFIPLGTGLYQNIQKRWVLAVPCFLSVAIETVQCITGLGIAEFDDVFGNTLGGLIGIGIAYSIRCIMDEQKERDVR